VVECFLAKEDVAGSTPVSRSKYTFSAIHSSYNQSGVRKTQTLRESVDQRFCAKA